MRVGSIRTVSPTDGNQSCWYTVRSMRRLDERHTSAWVRNPAGRPWMERSMPMAPPARSAAARCTRMSTRASAITRWTGNRAASSASVCMASTSWDLPGASRGRTPGMGRTLVRRGRYHTSVLRAAAALLAAALLVPARAAARGQGSGARCDVVLAGEQTEVRWTDGDTFRILSGPRRGRAVRLVGVNTLETYGPVHRIGASDGRALLAVAKASAAIASAAGGRCDTDGAVDGSGDPALLALQREAQRTRTGIWAGGAPPLLPTSLHSADEPNLAPRGYDRIVDTRTGAAVVHPHARTYRTCEEVCVGEGQERACMVYVPFARRYRDRPPCLR